MTSRRAAVVALITLGIAGSSAAAQGKSDAKPAPSADATAIIAQEISIPHALMKHDWPAFNKALGSNLVYVDPAGSRAMGPHQERGIAQGCTTTKVTMENSEATPAGSDIMVLTEKSGTPTKCATGKRRRPRSL